MRDRRFAAGHRGGALKKQQHRLLMRWACACAGHVLPLCGYLARRRLQHAMLVAQAWERGEASVGDARKAALAAIAVARESSDPTEVAVARGVGHAVATAHMADHCLGAAGYALKAVQRAGASVDAERAWQDRQLPRGTRTLVLSARRLRGI